MDPFRPISMLDTHAVTNQPPPLVDFNAYETDQALKRAVLLANGGRHRDRLSAFGARVGSAQALDWGRLANANTPVLKSFDRYGHRLDEIEFHPAYHELMRLGLEAPVSAAAWTNGETGHVLHAALLYLMTHADAGTVCPMSMTYAVVPALRVEPAVAKEWEPRVTAALYDPRFLPAQEKSGCTMGMAMTEKQGGSDVRANTTRAVPLGGGEYELTGHKWFCSAPMSDAFLTLAYVGKKLTCFLAPRWRPDGTRNAIHIMRLKDKMGDRSNASSEIEYHGAWARRVGDEGHGVKTIIDMVQGTRLDCISGSAAGMRAALIQALWHAAHRTAFQKRLIDQPAMQTVLADLCLESEAATAICFRVARAFDAASSDPAEGVFARLATPVAKYWVCKRQPGFVYEALECLGGAGYVEDGPMPRLFRQSPLNAIWEGSGNVIALDVLRALSREPDALEVVRAELSHARGGNAHLDAHLDRWDRWFATSAITETTARAFVEETALALQAAALCDGPAEVLDGFCALRLAFPARSLAYGAFTANIAAEKLMHRAMPTL